MHESKHVLRKNGLSFTSQKLMKNWLSQYQVCKNDTNPNTLNTEARILWDFPEVPAWKSERRISPNRPSMIPKYDPKIPRAKMLRAMPAKFEALVGPQITTRFGRLVWTTSWIID